MVEAMSSPEPESTTVRYTAKELFARIDQKLDVIAAQLVAKADHDELLALEIRVAVLEAAASEQKGFDRAKVAIIALALTIVGLVIPLVLRYVGT
jgi:hypothetical protein